MYQYETHLHTSPVSKCARAGVRETLEFYKSIGYDGVFITNHFLDGNINIDPDESYEKRIHFYFSDYEEAVKLSEEIGIRVFCGVEMSYLGTDFLIYGLDKEWYLKHPAIMEMERREELQFLAENGAFIVQAHPFREASYIDHIRLFPRDVHAVEIYNACRQEDENKLAEIYAEHYGLLPFAGTDNHVGGNRKIISGMWSEERICDEADFIRSVKKGEMHILKIEL